MTPSYNQGEFIAETIESVLSQNYPRLEYWVIDGASTDNTLEVLKKYRKYIHLISEKDRGQTQALNKGMRRAKGEVVAYLNSDDVYLPNTLQTVGEFFSQHPNAKWLTGDYFIVDQQGKKIQSYIESYKRFLRQNPSRSTLAVANYICQPSTFWRRSLFEDVGFFNEKLRYCMDFDFWMRLWEVTPPAVSDRHFSLFRVHTQSKGGSQYRKQFAEEHQVVCQHITNPALQTMHWLHAQAVVAAYQLLKG